MVCNGFPTGIDSQSYEILAAKERREHKDHKDFWLATERKTKLMNREVYIPRLDHRLLFVYAIFALFVAKISVTSRLDGRFHRPRFVRFQPPKKANAGRPEAVMASAIPHSNGRPQRSAAAIAALASK